MNVVRRSAGHNEVVTSRTERGSWQGRTDEVAWDLAWLEQLTEEGLGRGAEETSCPERRGKRAGEDEWKRRPGAKSIGGGGRSRIGVAELRERVDVAHRSTGRIMSSR